MRGNASSRTARAHRLNASRRDAERDRTPSANGKGAKIACNRFKSLHPIENIPEREKTQQRRKFSVIQLCEREATKPETVRHSTTRQKPRRTDGKHTRRTNTPTEALNAIERIYKPRKPLALSAMDHDAIIAPHRQAANRPHFSQIPSTFFLSFSCFVISLFLFC